MLRDDPQTPAAESAAAARPPRLAAIAARFSDVVERRVEAADVQMPATTPTPPTQTATVTTTAPVAPPATTTTTP